jgi:hypothetical protein
VILKCRGLVKGSKVTENLTTCLTVAEVEVYWKHLQGFKLVLFNSSNPECKALFWAWMYLRKISLEDCLAKSKNNNQPDLETASEIPLPSRPSCTSLLSPSSCCKSLCPGRDWICTDDLGQEHGTG